MIVSLAYFDVVVVVSPLPSDSPVVASVAVSSEADSYAAVVSAASSAPAVSVAVALSSSVTAVVVVSAVVVVAAVVVVVAAISLPFSSVA